MLKTIFAIIVSLSGWGKVLYDYLSSKPKIKGQVFQVMRGQMPLSTISEEKMTAFFTYVYLVNRRKNSIHVLDYELEIKIKNVWKKLKRVYGIHRIQDPHFLDPSGKEIQIQNFQENLIYRKAKPVEYGTPLHGWVVFAGNSDLHNADISDFKLTCIDAFQGRHRIKTKSNQLANLALLQDLADIQIPETARTNSP
ncbi:MAG TPA: hypothetical protein PK263_06345 [bacterium]|nr:hypothetical protein [bacterium]